MNKEEDFSEDNTVHEPKEPWVKRLVDHTNFDIFFAVVPWRHSHGGPF